MQNILKDRKTSLILITALIIFFLLGIDLYFCFTFLIGYIPHL